MKLEYATREQVLAMRWECTAAGADWCEYEDPKGLYGVTFEEGEEFGLVYEF